jgi:serine/threonine protein kinase
VAEKGLAMSETPKDAKGIFLAALDIPDAAERAAFLGRSCHSDPALRQRVEDLLLAYGQPDGPLDKLAAALASTQLGEPIREQVGATIGPYKLMEQIGEGGFGLVFVAEQQRPIRRKVALKIIKPGMDTRDVIARFEAERQALALMDHPNIARVLDAGTTDSGRPYFVMELVRGIPITDYCDQTQLTPRERLELFVPVCNAIQHAHLKGIIHRDIKPSNVLVTLHDDRPVVKVIDFGVAKALHQHLTEKTVYTRFAQMIGTPLYMSPEQAQMSGLDIDTRTDVYSLGVLLYELLTGTTPFNKERVAKAAYDELLKIIREEEPPKPSVRLSQSTDSLPSIAALRRTEPGKLSKMFDGDLDWIAMKALEKDRTRRYETANSFAADVLRYLNEEPVEASPPSAAYRLRKFARKHRKPVIALAAAAAILVLGVAGTTWGLVRARLAEQVADASKQEAVIALDQVTHERDAKEVARKLEAVQRDRAERELANGLLRPVAISERVDAAELRSFVDWSAIKDSSQKLRVLEIAFESPAVAFRVARRAERAIQACVGLSPIRCVQAVKFLAVKQRDLAADPRIRVAACRLALEVGSADLPAWSESCRYLGDPKNNSSQDFGELLMVAVMRSGHLDPELFMGLLETPTNGMVQFYVPRVFPELISRMNAAQIKHAADAVLGALEKLPAIPTDWGARNLLVGALSVMAPHLKPPEGTRAENVLVELLSHTGSYDQLFDLWAALAPKMKPEGNRRAWDALVSSAQSCRLGGAQDESLRALAARLPPTDVEHLWDVLAAIAHKTENSDSSIRTLELLMALRPQLSAEQVRRASGIFIGGFGKFPFSSADGLVLLAPQLEPNEVERAWDAALRACEAAPIEDDNHPIDQFPNITRALSALSPRLPAAHVDHACRVLLTTLRRNPKRENHGRDAVCDALEALSPRLDPILAKNAWDTLLAVPWPAWSSLETKGPRPSGAFVALVARLQPAQVSTAAQSLIAELETTSLKTDSPVTQIQGLSALAPRMAPSLIARAADALITIWEKSFSGDAVSVAVSDALIALGPRLDAVHAKRAWECVMTKIRKGHWPSRLGRFDGWPPETDFESLSPRLDAMEVVKAQEELVATLEKSTGFTARSAAIDLLIALSRRMDSASVARAATALMAMLQNAADTRNSNLLIEVSGWTRMVEGLLALAGQPGFPDQDRTSATAMTALLDLSSSYAPMRPDFLTAVELKAEIRAAILHSLAPRHVAGLLSHPGCLGELRYDLLRRFEEIAFYQGKSVFVEPATESQKRHPAMSPPPRRFQNLSDAAAWIQQNWPDFDLESNCPATWRGSH